MTHERFTIENIKCGGCVKSIKNVMLDLGGIKTIEVSLEAAFVEVDFDENLTTRMVIVEHLRSLGYPETGTGNVLLKAKSYVSCAVGKFS